MKTLLHSGQKILYTGYFLDRHIQVEERQRRSQEPGREWNMMVLYFLLDRKKFSLAKEPGVPFC